METIPFSLKKKNKIKLFQFSDNNSQNPINIAEEE